MRSTVVIRWLAEHPFKPFRIVMTDGLRIEIRHPDQAIAEYAQVRITTTSPDPQPTIGDYTISVSYLHIMRIEPILPVVPIEQTNGPQ